MVSDILRDRIESFCRNVNEPYQLVENVNSNQISVIDREDYINQIISLPEFRKNEIMVVLEQSWDENSAHTKRRHWGRCALGVAKFLLLPTEIDEVELPEAYDVIVRISKWFTTQGTFYKKFVPCAEKVVHLAWGHIENLRDI